MPNRDLSVAVTAARAAYAQAYATDAALAAGFGWYRTLSRDSAHNQQATQEVATPVLYLRGEQESGQIADYLTGLRAAGLTAVTPGLVPGAGHFTQKEAPAPTWSLIASFAGLPAAGA